jgi:hypothetical protein
MRDKSAAVTVAIQTSCHFTIKSGEKYYRRWFASVSAENDGCVRFARMRGTFLREERGRAPVGERTQVRVPGSYAFWLSSEQFFSER